MELNIIVIVFVLVLVYGLGQRVYWHVRGGRTLDKLWVATTSLPRDQVAQIVEKTMKGPNPLARVSRSGSGGFSREVKAGIRFAGQSTRNRAMLVSSIAENGGRRVVETQMTEWRGVSWLGLSVMSAVIKGGRRAKAINRAVVALDPSATVQER